jgi:outer membrane protein assembly factor BamB
LDLARDNDAMKKWTSEGGSPIGAPAFGSDGTLYITIGARTTVANSGYANAVVALDPKELTVKDWYTQSGSDFVTPPLIFKTGDKETIAVATGDGSIVLLDAASLGGPAHNNARARSPAPAGDVTGFIPTGIATWSDAAGSAWLLVPRATTLSALKVTLANGVVSIQPGWTSRQMRAPIAPVVVNGVVFVVSSGEFLPPATTSMNAADRARRSVPAVLYALDATTGRELWSSGNTMTAFVHGPALWPGIGQMHVATFDSTVYAFGFPLERY